MGIKLIPKNNGTQKLKVNKFVKFGGCGINLLTANKINIPMEVFK